MKFDDLLRQKLVDWRPAGVGRHDLTVSHPETGWTLYLSAERQDALSGLYWEVGLRRSGAPPLDAAALRRWAEHIAGRVSGLLQPLTVLEVDVAQPAALLRSREPLLSNGERTYDELRLNATPQAVLGRYQHAEGASRRQRIPFALTHDTLVRVVLDMLG
ncbi:MAG: hypothetical protein NZ700_14770 [Gemmataceae bacterium]|nr:hypothetical protein [Gemmataceae bacterium]MDW8264155.1 hypothetical protein [Gemmataceae bacterium]